jgi:hypothetical protein
MPTARIAHCFSTNDCDIAKRVIIFVPKFTKKSPFLNAQLARGALSAVSFSLQTSTTMAIHAYGKDCSLF